MLVCLSEVAPASEGNNTEKPAAAESATEKSSANQLKRDESKDSGISKPSSVQRSRDKNKDPNEPQVRESARTVSSV